MKRNQHIKCPSCKAAREVTFTVSAKLAPTESEALVSTGEIETQPARCKSCNQLIIIRLKVQIVDVITAEALPPQDKQVSYINTLTPKNAR